MEELEDPDQMNNCQYVNIQNGKQVERSKDELTRLQLPTVNNKNQIIMNKVVILIERGFTRRSNLL